MQKKYVLPLIFIVFLLLLIFPAKFLWSEQETFEPPNEKSPVKYDVQVQTVQKDQDHYAPGSKVEFTSTLSNKPEHTIDIKIEYYHLEDKIHEKIIPVKEKTFQWSWTTPKEGSKGYTVKVSPLHNKESFKTIAVDVSSH